MEIEILPRPIIFQTRKNCLSCTEYLLASFIMSKGFPYHWLFSDSWGTYYYGQNDFSGWQSFSPRQINTEKIYNMKEQDLPSDTLSNLLCDVDLRENCFIVYVDTFSIPWHPNFENTRSNHGII